MVIFMEPTLGLADELRASRFLTGLRDPHRHTRRNHVDPLRGPLSVGRRRHADEFGESGAESAQRREPDGVAHVGHRSFAVPQERHRPFNPPGHQVAVGRLAESFSELATEVAGREPHARAIVSTLSGALKSRSIRSFARRSRTRSLPVAPRSLDTNRIMPAESSNVETNTPRNDRDHRLLSTTAPARGAGCRGPSP